MRDLDVKLGSLKWDLEAIIHNNPEWAKGFKSAVSNLIIAIDKERKSNYAILFAGFIEAVSEFESDLMRLEISIDDVDTVSFLNLQVYSTVWSDIEEFQPNLEFTIGEYYKPTSKFDEYFDEFLEFVNTIKNPRLKDKLIVLVEEFDTHLNNFNKSNEES